MTQKKLQSLLNKADEGFKILKEHLDNENIVRIISHNDSDGLSSAGLVARAISENDGQFHVSIISRLHEEFIKKLAREKYKVFFFCDMGSSEIEILSKNLKGDVIVADHHQITGEINDIEGNGNIVHLNPHLFNIDGTQELSASGTAYLIMKNFEIEHLASMALVGAIGDMQCENGFLGVNKIILDEGLKKGEIKVKEDIRILHKDEYLYRALAFTFYPPLTGITGDFDSAKKFLEKIGINPKARYNELDKEEKEKLKESLCKINPDIYGKIYLDPGFGQLKDLRYFSEILDACGKSKEYGLALSICLKNKNEDIEKATKILKKYNEKIIKGLKWLKRENSKKMKNIQYVYTEDKSIKPIIGTLVSIAMSVGILDDSMPTLGLYKINNHVKVSARTNMSVVEKGVNLGKALKRASDSVGGNGGGHNVAAGAMIPYKEMNNFLNIVDEIVGEQKK